MAETYDYTFTIPGLDVKQTQIVALLCGMTYTSLGFRSAALYATRDSAFPEEGSTVGAYAEALLAHRLAYLRSLNLDVKS